MTNQKLQSLVKKWQKILKLQDWEVTARFASQYEFMTPKAEGQSTTNWHYRICRIKILKPQEYDFTTGYEQDIEETIVHELLHPWFSLALGEFHGENIKSRTDDVELMINTLAAALIKLDRQKKKKGK